MENWDDLKFVLAVARAGGLSGAARKLGVNHSTVSRRLSALEAALGTRLFERLPGGLVPTAAGTEAVEAANPEPEPVDSPLLLGEWDLEFTDAFDVLSLGLSPLEVGRISQNVRAGASAGGFAAAFVGLRSKRDICAVLRRRAWWCSKRCVQGVDAVTA